jgi:hypothetical protein
MRRSSANAPQRAGARRRKVAMDKPVREGASVSNPVLWPTRSRTSRRGWMSISRPHTAASVALTMRRSSANATRGHGAMEGGDERAGVKRRHSFERPTLVVPHRSARAKRRGQGRARPRARTRPPASPSRTRRSTANAPQRAGAAQRKVAMSARRAQQHTANRRFSTLHFCYIVLHCATEAMRPIAARRNIQSGECRDSAGVWAHL